ncbi:MAG TPA: tetratricopeptide repeat protein [Bryobacteraceae bacterium]|nr:tetratricopeptide repeat protein [Bryobacteraceae bacterium]
MRLAGSIALLIALGGGFPAAPVERPSDLDTAKRWIADGSPDRAVSILERHVAAHPEDADAHLLLGTALTLIPRRAEALASLHRAVDLRPGSAQAWVTLGNALARFGETKEARAAFERTLALDPKSVMAHANLAVILASEHEVAAAAAHFSRAIELLGDSPDSARYYYLRGKLYREQERLADAERDFSAAVRLSQRYAKAHLELGNTRAELGDEAGALKALRRAVALAPDDAEARQQLGSSYLRAGEPQRALEHLRAAARLRPDDRQTLYALARALRAAGQPQEAEPLLARISKDAREQAVREADVVQAGELNNAGIDLEKRGRLEAALKKYRAALEIAPHEVRFRRNAALALCRLERWQEAVVELKEVLRAAPGDPDATKALYIALDKTHEHPR